MFVDLLPLTVPRVYLSKNLSLAAEGTTPQNFSIAQWIPLSVILAVVTFINLQPLPGRVSRHYRSPDISLGLVISNPNTPHPPKTWCDWQQFRPCVEGLAWDEGVLGETPPGLLTESTNAHPKERRKQQQQQQQQWYSPKHHLQRAIIERLQRHNTMQKASDENEFIFQEAGTLLLLAFLVEGGNRVNICFASFSPFPSFRLNLSVRLTHIYIYIKTIQDYILKNVRNWCALFWYICPSAFTPFSR